MHAPKDQPTPVSDQLAGFPLARATGRLGLASRGPDCEWFLLVAALPRGRCTWLPGMCRSCRPCCASLHFSANACYVSLAPPTQPSIHSTKNNKGPCRAQACQIAPFFFFFFFSSSNLPCSDPLTVRTWPARYAIVDRPDSRLHRPSGPANGRYWVGGIETVLLY